MGNNVETLKELGLLVIKGSDNSVIGESTISYYKVGRKRGWK